MSLRIIQITLPAERKKTVLNLAEAHNALDIWWEPKNEDGLRTMSILVDRSNQQDVLDSIQMHLTDTENWRAVLLPVEATLPKHEEINTQPSKKFKWRKSLTREELYQEVAGGAEGDTLFYLMVILSTIVAAIGLIQDNVAIVIAAMVIAPLLGPNLALAFGTALGERDLVFQSLKTCIGGLFAAIIPCILLGYFLPVDLGSEELFSRTNINFAAIILALASGAAAVLSLATGVSSALVGVMVSVALLPPAAAFGIFLGLGRMGLAVDSGFLLLTNLASVGLSAQAVLIFMGIRPRTFLEKRAAKQSSMVQIGICIILLAIISVVILVKSPT
jgi:uncharacterized hydrophobic protein (TIGR00341 family)